MGDSLLSIQLRQWFSLFLSIIFIVVSFSTSTPTHISKKSSSTISNGFVLNLIPRDVIRPPTYPPGSTLLERMDLALSRVVTTRRSSRGPSSHSKYVVPPGNNAFYVNFSIGSQRTPQLATLDTTSPFLWVQCYGYQHGHPTMNPIYEPGVSVSYKPSTCFSAGDWYCKRVARGQCDEINRCSYYMPFRGEGNYSAGFLAFEDITFFLQDSPTPYMIENVLFGCGKINYDQDQVEDGVFGIGGTLSILKQAGSKFSICFGGITNPGTQSHLALGGYAKLLGVPVQALLYEDKYHVLLESIFIGKYQRVIFPPVEVVINTGATLTLIRREIYIEIRTVVEELIGTKMKKIKSKVLPDGLCYSAPELITDFPNVTMSFGAYSALLMDIRGMIWKTPGENAFCLAFEPSDDPNKNVMGVVNLQFHNVAINLENREAYFLRIDDCSKI